MSTNAIIVCILYTIVIILLGIEGQLWNKENHRHMINLWHVFGIWLIILYPLVLKFFIENL